MASLKNTLHITISCLIILFIISMSAQALTNEDFWLFAGSTEWGFTHAGYSDGFWWGNSTKHPHSRHEMLSGEFAAAIWWQDCGSNEAIWLTDRFEYPDFLTSTIFESYGTPPYSKWDDPNNPVDNPTIPSKDYDTAYAVIRDIYCSWQSVGEWLCGVIQQQAKR